VGQDHFTSSHGNSLSLDSANNVEKAGAKNNTKSTSHEALPRGKWFLNQARSAQISWLREVSLNPANARHESFHH